MKEPNKNGCWNCGNRERLLCKSKAKISEARIKDALKTLGRPLEEEQFKIPLTEHEAEVFGRNVSSEGDVFGEQCVLWTGKKTFVFR